MVQDRNRCRTGWTAGLACCPLHRSMDTCIIIKTLHRSFERGASCREVYYHFFSCKHGDIAKHRGERVVLCLPKNGGCKASRTAGCVFGGTTSSAKLSPRNFFHKASSRRALPQKLCKKARGSTSSCLSARSRGLLPHRTLGPINFSSPSPICESDHFVPEQV